MIRVMKRLLWTMVFAAIISAVPVVGTAAASTEQQTIPVYFNDELLEFNIDPIIQSDTTLVEFRPIFEKLGLQVGWNNETRTVTGSKEGFQIELTIGSRQALVNGDTVTLAQPAQIVRERTVIPLRFVAEAAGSYVSWDAASRTIRLYRIAPSEAVTTTNRIVADGSVPANTYWVKFLIRNEATGAESIEYARASSRKVSHELYLSDGPGKYRVSIYHTKRIDQNTSDYEFNARFSVVNSGESGLHLESLITYDSRVRLYGEPDESIRSVIVQAIHNTTEIYKVSEFEVINGRLDRFIYLNLGKGEYTIDLFTSTQSISDLDYEEAEYYNSFQVINEDERDPDLLPSEKVESDHTEIIELAQRLTAGLQSEYAKSKAIHDWVASNITYDAVTFLAGRDRSDSALETLRGRIADCDGYARLNAALHRAVGIKAAIVVGAVISPDNGQAWSDLEQDEVNHAWNKIYADGRWIVQDPTWNAGYINETSGSFVRNLMHDYFDPSPERFALDHREVSLAYKYE